MSVRVRLERLERRAERMLPNQPTRDLFAEIEEHAAYLRGEGPRPPDPPCPLGFDPAAWRSRMSVCRCLDERTSGELGERQYVPDMTAEEKAYVESILDVFAKINLDDETVKYYSQLIGPFESKSEAEGNNPWG
jgi:hypothetical protein